MTSTAVIQVKRGIGDVIWHLPFVRAIAGVSPGGKVTFLAPSSSGAKELLGAEPSVAATLYFEHAGSELQRGINLVRLAALLRRQRFGTIWILDRTVRPALAARVAGIPRRIGLGLGAQSLLISNPGVDRRHLHDHPIGWLRALMAAMKVPLPSMEPALRIPDQALAAVAAMFKDKPRPWIVFGIAASHPAKEWPHSYWAEFIAGVLPRINGTAFLIGGPENSMRAHNLIDGLARGAAVVNACDLTLIEAAALLKQADLFVGCDSAPLNIAAAAATEAFGLFGSTPVLNYSRYIHAIVPSEGISLHGMSRIAPVDVLERVKPYLAERKAR